MILTVFPSRWAWTWLETQKRAWRVTHGHNLESHCFRSLAVVCGKCQYPALLPVPQNNMPFGSIKSLSWVATQILSALCCHFLAGNNRSTLPQDPIVSLSWQLIQSLNSRCTARVILLGTKPVWLIWKSAKCGLGSTEHSCMVWAWGTASPTPINLSQPYECLPVISSCETMRWGKVAAMALFLHNHSQASPHSTGHWVWQCSSSSQANQLFLDLFSVNMYHVLGYAFYLWSLTLSLFKWLYRHQFKLVSVSSP